MLFLCSVKAICPFYKKRFEIMKIRKCKDNNKKSLNGELMNLVDTYLLNTHLLYANMY